MLDCCCNVCMHIALRILLTLCLMVVSLSVIITNSACRPRLNTRHQWVLFALDPVRNLSCVITLTHSNSIMSLVQTLKWENKTSCICNLHTLVQQSNFFDVYQQNTISCNKSRILFADNLSKCHFRHQTNQSEDSDLCQTCSRHSFSKWWQFEGLEMPINTARNTILISTNKIFSLHCIALYIHISLSTATGLNKSLIKAAMLVCLCAYVHLMLTGCFSVCLSHFW